MPKPPVKPPNAPSQGQAAKLVGDKLPNRNDTGLAQTILTQPQNLMETEANQRKTLLGQ